MNVSGNLKLIGILMLFIVGLAACGKQGSTATAESKSPVSATATTPAQSLRVVTSKLNDTGITASQCYEAANYILVACNSAGAIALNNAQDGMVGRDANPATNSNADGKLGFSFSAVPGGCVQDNVTGLMWEVKTTGGGLRDGNITYTNYSSTYDSNPSSYGAPTDASGFVAEVNTTNLCGYSDWRLPTLDELQSIVDYGVAYPGPTIDTTWFPNTQGKGYWSASPNEDFTSAWIVQFNEGRFSGIARGASNYVLLVRAGQSPTKSRYTVSADGQEVTDNQTSLIWRRCAEGMVYSSGTCTGSASTFTSQEALQHAAAQASSTGIAWRLPNVKELFSIADNSLSYPAIDSTAFPATPPSTFMSASSYVSKVQTSGDYISEWEVNFNNGSVQFVKIYTDYVRLVRASQ